VCQSAINFFWQWISRELYFHSEQPCTVRSRVQCTTRVLLKHFTCSEMAPVIWGCAMTESEVEWHHAGWLRTVCAQRHSHRRNTNEKQMKTESVTSAKTLPRSAIVPTRLPCVPYMLNIPNYLWYAMMSVSLFQNKAQSESSVCCKYRTGKFSTGHSGCICYYTLL